MKIFWAIATAFWCSYVLCDASPNVTDPRGPVQGNLQEPYESEGEHLGAKRERRNTQHYDINSNSYDVTCNNFEISIGGVPDALFTARLSRSTENIFVDCEFYPQSFDVVLRFGQRITVQFSRDLIEVKSTVCISSDPDDVTSAGIVWDDGTVTWDLVPFDEITDTKCTPTSIEGKAENVVVRGITSAQGCRGVCAEPLINLQVGVNVG